MIKTLIAVSAIAITNVAWCATPQLLPTPEGAKVNFVAEAQNTIPNDLATLVLSAQAESTNLRKAQEKVNELMNKAEKELKAFSPSSKLITVNYSVRPLYRDSSAVKSISSWEAVQKIRVTTKELDNVPALVQVAQTHGLALTSINYSLTNETLTKVNEELIGVVVQNLNKKASDIAKAMDLPLNLYSIERIDFDEAARPIGPALLTARAMPGNMEEAPLPVFEPGTTEVHKRAQVTLKLLPGKK